MRKAMLLTELDYCSQTGFGAGWVFNAILMLGSQIILGRFGCYDEFLIERLCLLQTNMEPLLSALGNGHFRETSNELV
ncbi:hypothetical protein Ciccas_014111 [Cichlidogyrus casuarinus]|uniref:Uncharacterized protein n=1 Tax=Cichlidogyrus casuarinus TaxID=1844966 RepID=A0ABD2PL49_9PLAT